MKYLFILCLLATSINFSQTDCNTNYFTSDEALNLFGKVIKASTLSSEDFRSSFYDEYTSLKYVIINNKLEYSFYFYSEDIGLQSKKGTNFLFDSNIIMKLLNETAKSDFSGLHYDDIEIQKYNNGIVALECGGLVLLPKLKF